MGTHNVKKSGGPPVGLIVCGPCACGKSEIASALASHFQVPFVDADSYHSEENIKKMSSGIALTDQDRFPWLVTVRQQMILQKKALESNPISSASVTIVAACSALKITYRDILSGSKTSFKAGESERKGLDESSANQDHLRVIFVFLNCSENVLQNRLNQRQGHFMKANMLASQLVTLEVPMEEAEQGHAVIVNGDAELKDVIQEAICKLQKLLET